MRQSIDTATAQSPSPAIPRSNDANMFKLQGKDISITYSATSITGQPLLHYKDRSHDVNVRGKEIRQVEAEIGTLVSITLEPDAGAGALLFTLVVPRVTLTSVGGEQAIKTVGLTTRNRMPPRLLACAQIQTYDAVDLKGSATFVVS